MIKRKAFFGFLPILFLFLVIPVAAQGRRWQMQPYTDIGLTEDQLNKIQELRIAFQKEILPLRMELIAGYLELDNLYMQDADQNKIDAKIDELDQMELEFDKQFSAHQQQIRGLLTDNQKVMFDRFGGLGMGFGLRLGYGAGFARGGGLRLGRTAGWNRGLGYGRGFNRWWGRGRGMGYGYPNYQRGRRCYFFTGWRFR